MWITWKHSASSTTGTAGGEITVDINFWWYNNFIGTERVGGTYANPTSSDLDEISNWTNLPAVGSSYKPLLWFMKIANPKELEYYDEMMDYWEGIFDVTATAGNPNGISVKWHNDADTNWLCDPNAYTGNAGTEPGFKCSLTDAYIDAASGTWKDTKPVVGPPDPVGFGGLNDLVKISKDGDDLCTESWLLENGRIKCAAAKVSFKRKMKTDNYADV